MKEWASTQSEPASPSVCATSSVSDFSTFSLVCYGHGLVILVVGARSARRLLDQQCGEKVSMSNGTEPEGQCENETTCEEHLNNNASSEGAGRKQRDTDDKT